MTTSTRARGAVHRPQSLIDAEPVTVLDDQGASVEMRAGRDGVLRVEVCSGRDARSAASAALLARQAVGVAQSRQARRLVAAVDAGAPACSSVLAAFQEMAGARLVEVLGTRRAGTTVLIDAALAVGAADEAAALPRQRPVPVG
jgi:hypothetical protein